jgi:hypothetical protein
MAAAGASVRDTPPSERDLKDHQNIAGLTLTSCRRRRSKTPRNSRPSSFRNRFDQIDPAYVRHEAARPIHAVK